MWSPHHGRTGNNWTVPTGRVLPLGKLPRSETFGSARHPKLITSWNQRDQKKCQRARGRFPVRVPASWSPLGFVMVSVVEVQALIMEMLFLFLFWRQTQIWGRRKDVELMPLTAATTQTPGACTPDQHPRNKDAILCSQASQSPHPSAETRVARDPWSPAGPTGTRSHGESGFPLTETTSHRCCLFKAAPEAHAEATS